MAKPDQIEIQERRKQPPAGDDARERLLAELPVTERRVQSMACRRPCWKAVTARHSSCCMAPEVMRRTGCV